LKATNSINEAKTISIKYTSPNSSLVKWFKKRFTLEEERSEFEKTHAKAGKKLSKKFYKKSNESSARKSDILDKIIFPSMVNLIYFFECVNATPKMKELFEKDIITLLDLRKVKDSAEGADRGMEPWVHTFEKNNFARLIYNIVSLDKEWEDKIDFRVAVLYQLQLIINAKVERLMKNEFGSEGQIAKSSKEDFDNVVGWLAMMAKSIPDDLEKDSNRKIVVLPEQEQLKNNMKK